MIAFNFATPVDKLIGMNYARMICYLIKSILTTLSLWTIDSTYFCQTFAMSNISSVAILNEARLGNSYLFQDYQELKSSASFTSMISLLPVSITALKASSYLVSQSLQFEHLKLSKSSRFVPLTSSHLRWYQFRQNSHISIYWLSRALLSQQ